MKAMRTRANHEFLLVKAEVKGIPGKVSSGSRNIAGTQALESGIAAKFRVLVVLLAVAAMSAVAGCADIRSSANPGADAAHVRGSISECARYENLHPGFAKAFAFMRRQDIPDLPCGRYEIDGSNCWAMVQEASLKPFADENRYEVHRAFIDIQAPITGSETIGVTEPDPKVFDGFNKEKDCVLFMAKGEPWTLKPGEFAIFFPENGAHAPGLSMDGPRKIRKLVIKVRAGL